METKVKERSKIVLLAVAVLGAQLRAKRGARAIDNFQHARHAMRGMEKTRAGSGDFLHEGLEGLG